MEKQVWHRLSTLIILLLVTVWAHAPDLFVSGSKKCPDSLLCVVFLDVGQGDATFIQSPTGMQLLIDGGRGTAVLRELSGVMSFWDREIDHVLITHPDADHVGGLVEVFDRYQINSVIRTDNESDTSDWQATKDRIETEESTVFMARRGAQYELGGGVKLEILFPDREMSEIESNTASIVARLTYGDTSFLLTGDSPKSIEEYLVLTDGEHLKSDVLKVGHHGSRTSTSELFLEHVAPKWGIISAGEDNRYGHPHVEVTDLLFNSGVTTYSTAQNGTIVFTSNGQELIVR